MDPSNQGLKVAEDRGDQFGDGGMNVHGVLQCGERLAGVHGAEDVWRLRRPLYRGWPHPVFIGRCGYESPRIRSNPKD